MKVCDLMTKNVVTVRPTDTVNQVADLLFAKHFTGVPVADEQGRLLGMIAERDFIASDSKLYLPTYIKLLQEMDYIKGDNKKLPLAVKKIIGATAGDIMNTEVVTTTESTELQKLALLFATKRVNPIPVVNKDNKLVGIISRSDLIKLFSQKNI